MIDKTALAREVRRLAIPAILHSLLQTLVFVVDRVMLGRHGESSLAAMQIGGALEWSIWSVFSAFEVGTIAVAVLVSSPAIGALNAEVPAAVPSLDHSTSLPLPSCAKNHARSRNVAAARSPEILMATTLLAIAWAWANSLAGEKCSQKLVTR